MDVTWQVTGGSSPFGAAGSSADDVQLETQARLRCCLLGARVRARALWPYEQKLRIYLDEVNKVSVKRQTL